LGKIGGGSEDLQVMAKLNSVFPFPMKLFPRGLPTNLFVNKRPDSKFEVVKLLPGPTETDFEILHTCSDYQSAQEWAIEYLRRLP